MTSEAGNSILDTTTTLYCHHHGEGNPSMLLPLQGVDSVLHRVSKPDDRMLRTIGISTIRQSGRDFHSRTPLSLFLLQHFRYIVFEIHCDEGCSMIDVLQHLSKRSTEETFIFLVDGLKPDDNYTMVHSDLVTIRPGRLTAQKLPPSTYHSPVSSKIKNRGRSLFSVHEWGRAN